MWRSMGWPILSWWWLGCCWTLERLLHLFPLKIMVNFLKTSLVALINEDGWLLLQGFLFWKMIFLLLR
jgi:hypothetical protein